MAIARAAQLPQLVGDFQAWSTENRLALGLARWHEAALNAPLRTPRELNRDEARALWEESVSYQAHSHGQPSSAATDPPNKPPPSRFPQILGNPANPAQ